MLERKSLPLARACLLALSALVLGACAGPEAVPTATSTAAPATSTAPPPTDAAAAESTEFAVGQQAVPATSIRLWSPSDLAFDADGNLFIPACHDQGPQLYRIDSFGLLTVISSPPFGSLAGDGGPTLSATLACAEGLALDRDDNLYVVDHNNNRIRRIDRNGIISTVVGSGPTQGGGSFAGDGGPALAAKLNHPSDIAFDADGNLYIDDFGNNRIRKVDLQGVITTVAGTGEAGFSGDGGLATAANLNLSASAAPGTGIVAATGVAIDDAGNLYIADSGSDRVRKIDQAGTITTVAGTGEPTFSGDGGQATLAAIREPWGIAFDSDGNLFLADSGNDRVRRIATDGIISTVAGGRP